MPTMFSDCKGKVVVARSGGAGWYELNPGIKVSGGALNILRGTSAGLSDIHMPVTTLAGTQIIYAFGPAWSDVNLEGVLMLGDSSTGGAGTRALQEYAQQNRISKSSKPITLSAGKASFSVYLVGMTLGAVDENFNTQSYVLRFKSVE